MARKIKIKNGEIDKTDLAGVQIWEQRRAPGRPRAYETPEELWECAIEYFEWNLNNPLMETKIVKVGFDYELAEVPKMRAMSIRGLCGFLGVNSEYFYQMEANYRKATSGIQYRFSKIIKRISDVIKQQKYEGAASGFLSERMIARELDLDEKLKIDLTSGGEPVSMAPVVIPYHLIENVQKDAQDAQDEQE